jgi:cysteine desulfurase
MSKIDDFIFLDNNSTTPMPQSVINTMVEWTNKGNASSSYAPAKEATNMINNFKKYLAPNSNFEVIITSGASESNAMIIQSTIESANKKGQKPHIIISSIEHNSIIYMCKYLQYSNKCDITYIKPYRSGHIYNKDVLDAIQPNTCLVSIMTANNETGAINDVEIIAQSCHEYGIPFHTDSSQSFGKLPPTYDTFLDAITITFHKYNGPQGLGALIIRKEFLESYKLQPLIFGSQNNRLRGGTENIAGCASAFAGLKYHRENRLLKNKQLLENKKFIMKYLCEKYRCVNITKYEEWKKENFDPNDSRPTIVFLSSDDDKYLPNTLLLSIIRYKPPLFCNIKIKKHLESNNIIVSIGSACNTKNKEASHVLYEMNCDEYIRSGTLRISLGDQNTTEHVKKFCNILSSILH